MPISRAHFYHRSEEPNEFGCHKPVPIMALQRPPASAEQASESIKLNSQNSQEPLPTAHVNS